MNYDLSNSKEGDLEYIGFIDKLISLTEADEIRWVSFEEDNFLNILSRDNKFKQLVNSNLTYRSLFENKTSIHSYSIFTEYKDKPILIIGVKVRGKPGYEIYSHDAGLVKICNTVFGESELYEKINNLFIKGLASSRKNRISEQARNIMNLV